MSAANPATTYESLRTAPHSIASEQSVLGGLLLDNTAWSKVKDLLTETDFYRQDHRLIFRTAKELLSANQPADVLTMSEYLDQHGNLQEAGGLAYLAIMAKDTPSSARIISYAEIVKTKSIKRQMIAVLSESADEGYRKTELGSNEKNQISNTIQHCIRELAKIDAAQMDEDKSMTLAKAQREGIDLIHKYSLSEDGVIGIDTGRTSLNRAIGGWHDTDFIVILGRSGMGKTIEAMTNVYAAAKTVPVGFFSSEMAAIQIGIRSLSTASGVSTVDMRLGKLEEYQWAMMANGIKNDKESGLSDRVFINDSSLEISEIERQARIWVREKGVKLIVLDYIQNIQVDKRGVTGEKIKEVMEVSSRLKQLAKELSVPIIGLSQAKQAIDTRPDKRPTAGDAAWASQIQNDADVMIGLYRHGYYDKSFQAKAVCEKIIMKNRHGEESTQFDLFRTSHSDFIDAEEGQINAYYSEINRSIETKKSTRQPRDF